MVYVLLRKLLMRLRAHQGQYSQGQKVIGPYLYSTLHCVSNPFTQTLSCSRTCWYEVGLGLKLLTFHLEDNLLYSLLPHWIKLTPAAGYQQLYQCNTLILMDSHIYLHILNILSVGRLFIYLFLAFSIDDTFITVQIQSLENVCSSSWINKPEVV